MNEELCCYNCYIIIAFIIFTNKYVCVSFGSLVDFPFRYLTSAKLYQFWNI